MIGWAAGLFEGEGSFYTRVRKDRPTNQPGASIQMTDQDVLEKFRDVVGFGKVLGPYNYGHKPVYKWEVSGLQYTQALVAMLWPYLGERRKAAAKRILADPT